MATAMAPVTEMATAMAMAAVAVAAAVVAAVAAVVTKKMANANSWGRGKELTINYQNAKKWQQR